MVKKLLICYKKGIVSDFYKSKSFEEKKRQQSLYPPPGDSVSDTTLDTEEIIPYDQEAVIN